MIIKVWSSLDGPRRVSVLRDVKQVEKRTFPATEALDLDAELRKSNTILLCAFDETNGDDDLPGYSVYARSRRIALLHKVCVLEEHRRGGVGKAMLSHLHSTLLQQGCSLLCLWVDEARRPARLLYGSCGFQQLQTVPDYYGPGRTGVKMILKVS